MFNFIATISIVLISSIFTVNCNQNDNSSILIDKIVELPTTDHGIIVDKGDSFWINCTFELASFEKPWVLTVKKVGAFPLEIYQYTSENVSKVKGSDDAGFEIQRYGGQGFEVHAATDRAYGEYDCELVDGKTKFYSSKITVIDPLAPSSDAAEVISGSSDLKSSMLILIFMVSFRLIIFSVLK